METITVGKFRNEMAKFLDLASSGERVIVRRNHRMYTILPVEDDELSITPALQAKIDRARQDYKEGKCSSCDTPEELSSFLESL